MKVMMFTVCTSLCNRSFGHTWTSLECERGGGSRQLAFYRLSFSPKTKIFCQKKNWVIGPFFDCHVSMGVPCSNFIFFCRFKTATTVTSGQNVTIFISTKYFGGEKTSFKIQEENSPLRKINVSLILWLSLRFFLISSKTLAWRKSWRQTFQRDWPHFFLGIYFCITSDFWFDTTKHKHRVLKEWIGGNINSTWIARYLGSLAFLTTEKKQATQMQNAICLQSHHVNRISISRQLYLL